MSKQKCQDETTSTEYLDWQAHLDWLETQVTKDQHYFAQICTEIRRTIAKNPADPEIYDFILKFVREKKLEEMTEEEVEEAKKASAEQSKAAWMAAVGFGGKTKGRPLPKGNSNGNGTGTLDSNRPHGGRRPAIRVNDARKDPGHVQQNG